MTSLPIILSCSAFTVAIAVLYLRVAANRAGLKAIKDPGMLLVSLPAAMAVTGIANANVWASLFGLLLAVFAIVCYALRFISEAKAQ